MVGHIAETGQIVACDFREGNTPPAKDNLSFIRQCQDSLPAGCYVQRLRVDDVADNCPRVINSNQNNNDDDSEGDACDIDDDNDSIEDAFDNCQFTANPNQLDTDEDLYGDACGPDDNNDLIDS